MPALLQLDAHVLPSLMCAWQPDVSSKIGLRFRLLGLCDQRPPLPCGESS